MRKTAIKTFSIPRSLCIFQLCLSNYSNFAIWQKKQDVLIFQVLKCCCGLFFFNVSDLFLAFRHHYLIFYLSTPSQYFLSLVYLILDRPVRNCSWLFFFELITILTYKQNNSQIAEIVPMENLMVFFKEKDIIFFALKC